MGCICDVEYKDAVTVKKLKTRQRSNETMDRFSSSTSVML